MTRGERDIAIREREAKTIRLRMAGLTFAEIGEALGVRESMAHRIYQRALNRVVREPGEEQVALEVARLDALQRAIWGKALAGNLAAVDRALAIARRRADLLGLDDSKPLEAAIHLQVELVLNLVQKSLMAVFPDDGARYAIAMDSAVAELRRIATDQVGPDDLEVGP